MQAVHGLGCPPLPLFLFIYFGSFYNRPLFRNKKDRDVAACFPEVALLLVQLLSGL